MRHLRIKELTKKTLFPGFESRIIHTESATIAFVDIEKGCELPMHSHHNEQTLNLLEGELELVVGEEKILLKGGESVVLEPNVIHGGRAITTCKVQDIFVPRRDDWID